MGYWDVVDREDGMDVIKSTWDFKLKKYPDRIIKISKLDSVLVVTCNSKEYISLRLLRLLLNGPQLVCVLPATSPWSVFGLWGGVVPTSYSDPSVT